MVIRRTDAPQPWLAISALIASAEVGSVASYSFRIQHCSAEKHSTDVFTFIMRAMALACSISTSDSLGRVEQMKEWPLGKVKFPVNGCVMFFKKR